MSDLYKRNYDNDGFGEPSVKELAEEKRKHQDMIKNSPYWWHQKERYRLLGLPWYEVYLEDFHDIKKPSLAPTEEIEEFETIAVW